jgi:hypothetical protein
MTDDQRRSIKAHWPGVPSLRSQWEHTDAELDVIEACIEDHTRPRRHELDMATLAGPPPDVSVPDEGPDVADEDVAALRAQFDRLDVAEKRWLSSTGAQCKAAGYRVNLGAGPTRRRWSIGTAMLHCARLGVGTDDTHEATVRAMVGVVVGEEIQPAVPLGTAFAALTIGEAERLAVLARAADDPGFELSWNGAIAQIGGPAVEPARPERSQNTSNH